MLVLFWITTPFISSSARKWVVTWVIWNKKDDEDKTLIEIFKGIGTPVISTSDPAIELPVEILQNRTNTVNKTENYSVSMPSHRYFMFIP